MRAGGVRLKLCARLLTLPAAVFLTNEMRFAMETNWTARPSAAQPMTALPAATEPQDAFGVRPSADIERRPAPIAEEEVRMDELRRASTPMQRGGSNRSAGGAAEVLFEQPEEARRDA